MFIPWHDFSNPVPESRGMIFNYGMDELMDHHVVDDLQRGKDQPPGEIEVSLGAA